MKSGGGLVQSGGGLVARAPGRRPGLRRRAASLTWKALAFITVHEIGSALLLNGGLDFNFRDNYYLDADNDEHLVQHAVTLINARIGISDVDDTWELELLGKNLTDETWSPNGTDIPLTDGKFFKLTSPPRSFSLQFTVRI